MSSFERAFPNVRHDGMSLRDYFAGQYLAGAVNEAAEWKNFKDLATDCCRAADELMRALGHIDEVSDDVS